MTSTTDLSATEELVTQRKSVLEELMKLRKARLHLYSAGELAKFELEEIEKKAAEAEAKKKEEEEKAEAEKAEAGEKRPREENEENNDETQEPPKKRVRATRSRLFARAFGIVTTQLKKKPTAKLQEKLVSDVAPKRSEKELREQLDAIEKLLAVMDKAIDKQRTELLIVDAKLQHLRLSEFCITQTEPRLHWQPRQHTVTTKVMRELSKVYHSEQSETAVKRLRATLVPLQEHEQARVDKTLELDAAAERIDLIAVVKLMKDEGEENETPAVEQVVDAEADDEMPHLEAHVEE
ncbi:MAG: hypothetical protein MHM6MM_001471 [Cercozoa sp. M6MM]